MRAESTFDWYKHLNSAISKKLDSKGLFALINEADLFEYMPQNMDGKPFDMRLFYLSNNFLEYIQTCEWKQAKNTLRKIDARINQLANN